MLYYYSSTSSHSGQTLQPLPTFLSIEARAHLIETTAENNSATSEALARRLQQRCSRNRYSVHTFPMSLCPLEPDLLHSGQFNFTFDMKSGKKKHEFATPDNCKREPHKVSVSSTLDGGTTQSAGRRGWRLGWVRQNEQITSSCVARDVFPSH